MSFLDDFKERYKRELDSIRDRLDTIGALHYDANDFDKEMVSIINAVFKDMGKTYPELRSIGIEPKDLEEIIKSGSRSDSRKLLENTRRKVSELVFARRRLLSLSGMLAAADRGEKIRAFILRMSTAIGVAAVILITSYLAQKWGIPLPLRMGV